MDSESTERRARYGRAVRPLVDRLTGQDRPSHQVPVIFSDEALREGVAMAKLRGKDLTTAEVKAIVNAVLALEVAREIQRRPTGLSGILVKASSSPRTQKAPATLNG